MSTYLLKIALYCSCLNLLFTPISNSIAKVFGYATILIFVLSIIFPMIQTNKVKIHIIVIGIMGSILLSFCFSLKSLQVHSLETTIDNIMSIVAFVIFYWGLSYPVQEKNAIVLEDVFKVNYVLVAIFVLYAFGPFSFKYETINEYGDTLYTMGLGNPNASAILVMFASTILLIQLCSSNKLWVKVINVILIGILIYILVKLSSRTVLFCLLLVISLLIFKTSKYIYILSYISIFVSLFMIFFQLRLLNADIGFTILSKDVSTGRPEMYKTYIETISNNPFVFIWGDLCKYNFYNAHNGILTIFLNLGIIGVVLYYIFWMQQFRSVKDNVVEKHQIIAFATIIAILIHSSSESMGVIGVIPYSLYVLIIMRIVKGEIRGKYDRVTDNTA